MYWIVYNCIRCLVVEACKRYKTAIKSMSFKGSLQAIRQWEVHFYQPMTTTHRYNFLESLYESIAQKIIPDWPNRKEPRAVKRRPKPFQLLNKPRHEMREIQHRSTYAKPA